MPPLTFGCVFDSVFISRTTGWERVPGHPGLAWWLAAPLIAASLHVFEEFVFPGGFRIWYARYRPEIGASLTVKFLVIVNAVMLSVCALVALVGPSANGAANWFVITTILFWNAIFHLRAAVRMRSYSPGMITGAFLYIPMAVVGSVVVLRARLVPWVLAVACVGVGSLYQVFSLRNHRRRAKAQAEQVAARGSSSAGAGG